MKFYHTQLKINYITLHKITSKYKLNVLQEKIYIKLPFNDRFKSKFNFTYNNLPFFGCMAEDWDGKRFLATEFIFELGGVTGEINSDGDKTTLLFSGLLSERSL